MARSEARIVLLGRPGKSSSKFKGDLLADVNPTEIPKEFIEKIEITFSSGQTVEFGHKRITRNFTMEAMHEVLKQFGTKGKVTLIEVTLDLDTIYEALRLDSDNILGKNFK